MKTKSSTSIIAYVGNGVVKGGIVYHEFGKKPLILTARIKELKYNSERDRSQLESLILTDFENLIKEIKVEDFPKINNKKFRNPDTALIIISSPWYLPETNTIKMQENSPFTITEDLINKAVLNITKEHKGEDSSLSVLEQNFLSVNLNGYSLENPIGKKTKDFDITVFTSYAKKDSIKKIHRIIERNFHLHNIFIHSQSIVSFSALNDLYPDSKSYVIIDITSAITEILIIKDGVLKDSGSFPFGKTALLETVANTLNSNLEIAESLIKNYLDNKLEEEKKVSVQSAIEIAKKAWLDNFSTILKGLIVIDSLPKDFYLFASPFVSPLFKLFIESEEYQQSSLSEGSFEVRAMNVVNSCSLCDIEKTASENQELDTSIVIGSLFNNKKLFG